MNWEIKRPLTFFTLAKLAHWYSPLAQPSAVIPALTHATADFVIFQNMSVYELHACMHFIQFPPRTHAADEPNIKKF